MALACITNPAVDDPDFGSAISQLINWQVDPNSTEMALPVITKNSQSPGTATLNADLTILGAISGLFHISCFLDANQTGALADNDSLTVFNLSLVSFNISTQPNFESRV